MVYFILFYFANMGYDLFVVISGLQPRKGFWPSKRHCKQEQKNRAKETARTSSRLESASKVTSGSRLSPLPNCSQRKNLAGPLIRLEMEGSCCRDRGTRTSSVELIPFPRELVRAENSCAGALGNVNGQRKQVLLGCFQLCLTR